MIDVDAAFGQEFLDVAVGQPVAQLPAHRHRDHFWRETESGERGPRYRWGATTAHQTTLPDLRSVNATAPANEQWVDTMRRISPRLLTDLLAATGDQVVQFWHSGDFDTDG
jgi:hypothetical protein